MDLHHKQEVTVGALVIVGVGLFLAGTMWLRGASFSSEPRVQVMFPNAGTLKKGSPVKVSGVDLGQVEDIAFQGVGRVLISLSLESVVTPRIDASARLRTIGLVADAIVEFDPGTSSERLPPDRVIQGTVDRGLTEIGGDLSERANQVLGGIQEVANKELADQLRQTLEAMRRMMNVFANTKQGPTAELTATMRSLRDLSARLDSTLAGANLAATLRKSDTLFTTFSTTGAELTRTTARMDTLLQRLNSGQGTLGKLMTDSLLYGDLRRLTKAAQELIDEIRAHPGKLTIQVKVF